MKLVAFFVAGDVEEAVNVVNTLNLTYEFSDMMPGTKQQRFVTFDGGGAVPASLALQGHYVFVKLTDLRVNWLYNNLKKLGYAS